MQNTKSEAKESILESSDELTQRCLIALLTTSEQFVVQQPGALRLLFELGQFTVLDGNYRGAVTEIFGIGPIGEGESAARRRLSIFALFLFF